MLLYESYKNALKNIPKPCAFVDMDAFNKNIKSILAGNNGKKIRVASKSIRSVPMLKKILSYSDVFQGIMCYTAEEAIFLSKQGFDDLLIAYPIWNEDQLSEISKLVKSGKIITVMIDCVDHIERLEKVAEQTNGNFLVCIDIDLSSKLYGIHFGVHRSPIQDVEQVISLVKLILDSPSLELDGVMGYEAQIAGVTDNDPRQKIKSKLMRFFKKRSTKQLIIKRERIVKAINKLTNMRFVNGGGTGSLHQTSLETSVTEVTVGSGFFNSHLFDNYKDFKLSPAAYYAIEITRKPSKHIYTCFGGGYVASGALNIDKLPQVFLPKGAKLTTNEAAGEVQTPVIYDGDLTLNLGDPIIMRHSKAGELSERFQELYLIENGQITEVVNTYRGDQQCFL